MQEEKHFDEWNEAKKGTHMLGRTPAFKEGEIWWCAMGENIGVEINGKNEKFSRPVLIMKKISRFGFMGIPLTSQKHEGSWYAPFIFRNKKQIAVLAQARIMSASRLYNRMGTLPSFDLATIKASFSKLYLE